MAGRLASILLCLPLLYLLAALAGALIPVNAGWSPPDRGVTIFVRTNGVHTEIVMPAAAAGVDWRAFIRADDLRRPELAGDHLAFGWGSRDFYLRTPTWADLDARTALKALFGRGSALMHVSHLKQPEPGPDQRPLTLMPDQYRRLAAFIRASFTVGADGLPIPMPGYGPADLFYQARGSYDLFRTSNEWTGAALRASGVRVGVWTPFAGSVMWRLG